MTAAELLDYLGARRRWNRARVLAAVEVLTAEEARRMGPLRAANAERSATTTAAILRAAEQALTPAFRSRVRRRFWTAAVCRWLRRRHDEVGLVTVPHVRTVRAALNEWTPPTALPLRAETARQDEPEIL